MKQEQVIELAKKADKDFLCEPWSIIGIEAVERFAELVEQATLERAAEVCESWRGGKVLLNAGEMSAVELRTVRAVTGCAAREIRNLAKEST